MRHSPIQTKRLSPQTEERFLQGAREASRYFMNKSNVHRALERLVDRLTKLKIPCAESVHPHVRAKFRELWQAAQVQDGE